MNPCENTEGIFPGISQRTSRCVDDVSNMWWSVAALCPILLPCVPLLTISACTAINTKIYIQSVASSSTIFGVLWIKTPCSRIYPSYPALCMFYTGDTPHLNVLKNVLLLWKRRTLPNSCCVLHTRKAYVAYRKKTYATVAIHDISQTMARSKSWRVPGVKMNLTNSSGLC